MSEKLSQNTELEQPSKEVVALASTFHEDWRQTRLQEDGTFEPKLKDTKDEAWMEAHQGEAQVDISNTVFEDLPSDWQAENLAAAKVAQDVLEIGINSNQDLRGERFINQAGALIHDAWLKREANAYAAGGELDVPFDQLTQEQKDKDISQIAAAVELYQDEYYPNDQYRGNVKGTPVESTAKAREEELDKENKAREATLREQIANGEPQNADAA